MIKVNCNNSICGEVYYFNNERFPNATKVKCPKCGQVQARPSGAGASPAPIEANDDVDWFKPKEKPIESSPVLIYDTPQVDSSFMDTPQPSTEEEDFFTPVKKPVQAERPQPVQRPVDNFQPISTQAPTPNHISPDAIGWLVIHDEYTESRTFSLRKGLNRIGRSSDSTPRDVNICIETQDIYMSRHHCDIEVRQKPNGGYEYILSDRDYGGKKASANGTFLNARKRLTPNDEPILQDNDTIQVGRTKVVLKLPTVAQNAQDAANRVQQMDFFQTIIN
jgi:ribosomal protein S27E